MRRQRNAGWGLSLWVGLSILFGVLVSPALAQDKEKKEAPAVAAAPEAPAAAEAPKPAGNTAPAPAPVAPAPAPIDPALAPTGPDVTGAGYVGEHNRRVDQGRR